MREAFKTHRFSAASRELIDTVNKILSEYANLGYDLTLRQLYYQLVARGHIPNNFKSYKNVGAVVNQARLAGEIDWGMITDRGRSTVANTHWEDPADLMEVAAGGFQIDKWADQPVRVEIMVEKQALEGILIPVCMQLDVPFSANKGYSSSSAMYTISKRIGRYIERGQSVLILYLGDHDPSGIDMQRDIRSRLEMFTGNKISVKRLALTFNQVREMNPPENPVKEKDARSGDYIARFGQSCWELDAIEPKALASLVRRAVESVRDNALWSLAVSREERMRSELRTFARTYRAKFQTPETRRIR